MNYSILSNSKVELPYFTPFKSLIPKNLYQNIVNIFFDLTILCHI